MGTEVINLNYPLLMNNNDLLKTWLLRTMSMDVLHHTFGLDTTFLVWKTIKDNLLPTTKVKEIYLTNNLMGLKKEDRSIDEYI